MNRTEILNQAIEITTKDRNNTHGEPENSFRKIAAIWSAILDKPIAPHTVALLMAGLKIARAAGKPDNPDNWVDLAGYAACGAECVPEPDFLQQHGMPIDLQQLEKDILNDPANPQHWTNHCCADETKRVRERSVDEILREQQDAKQLDEAIKAMNEGKVPTRLEDWPSPYYHDAPNFPPKLVPGTSTLWKFGEDNYALAGSEQYHPEYDETTRTWQWVAGENTRKHN